MAIDKKHLTIENIAEMAGVSPSTVSRVLNNSAPVSKKTRSKIERIIKNTNYSPNALARGLRKSSKTIGLLIPDINNLFFIEVILGIEDVLNENGFSSFFCNTAWDPDKERQYIDLMVERRVEGLVIMATFVDETMLKSLPDMEIQIVSIHNGIKGLDSVYSKDQEGAFMATEHLIEMGHRRIAFLGFKNILNSLNNRISGYKSALTKHGIEVKEDYIVYCEPHGDYGYKVTQPLFKLPEMPSAILAINDQMAPGIYRALKERGLSVPQDVSVIGFDNTALCEWLSPKLTTVAQPNYEIGRNAASLLLEKIKSGNDSLNKEILLPTELILRESTAEPRQ